jgi:EAL domain-containing protein (putative c-di-GMP-specific phosphodiesterase class I)
LKVELTESTLMKHLDVAAAQLHKLKKGGVRIALDDFGTGYSSFSYLAQLPIDTLKIDKSFILSLFDIHSHRHIVEAMSNLAHILGMRVTAEGVEESVHFDFLVERRVDTLQGFHLSRPLPKEEIFRRIKKEEPYFTPSGSFGYTV